VDLDIWRWCVLQFSYRASLSPPLRSHLPKEMKVGDFPSVSILPHLVGLLLIVETLTLALRFAIILRVLDYQFGIILLSAWNMSSCGYGEHIAFPVRRLYDQKLNMRAASMRWISTTRL
jgi:hypothetical protein